MPTHLASLRFEHLGAYGSEYYRRNKAQGLDLLAYGEWQRRYGWWIVGSLQLFGRRVLDVGCACGSMLRGIWHAGADVTGVDSSEYFVQLGREEWPEMGGRLSICDAVNLPHIPDGRFDWIHSCVVAEHWRPKLVPHILEELQRVLKPGGKFYCAYESDTAVMANGKDTTDELTHLCLKPEAWWEEQLRNTGWQIDSTAWASALRDHPESLLPDYDWSWFVARRPP